MIAKKYRVERNLIPYILKKGESLKSNLFIIRYSKNNKNFCRFRTIVSQKIQKKAVKRNRLRRQIYEAVRIILKESEETKALDIILIPKKSILQAAYINIEQDIKETLPKLKIDN